MANIKSQKKRILTNEKARQRNMSVKNRLRTYIKRTNAALEAKNLDEAKALMPETLSEIDRAAKKGVIHANSAARKKSHFQRELAAISK